jgi:photosystem II stability/assembly factor-like uncharacterized protein
MKTFLYIIFFTAILTVNLFSNNIAYKVEHFYNFHKNVLTFAMDISCIDENNCIFLKTDNNATGLMLEKTTDGGNSWTLIYADTSFKSSDSVYYPKYFGVACKYFSDGTIVILTDYGKIIRSDDFGESFEEIQINNYFYKSFDMLDSKNALTISSAYVELPNAKYQILKSTDGCKSWEDIPVPDSISQRWLFGTFMLQKDNSFIIRCIAKYGLESDSTKNYFYHTDFEGSFWKYLEMPKYIQDIYFFNKNEGFATGRIRLSGIQDDTAIVVKTYDGGKTWEFKSKTLWPYEWFSSRLIHNDSIIFIAGSLFGFHQSTDKGESWFIPEYQITDGVYEVPYVSSIEAYFDSGIVYFVTGTPTQCLKGTKVVSSVASPSVKPKRIYPNPVTYGTDFIAEYEIAIPGHLKMYLSDLAGREVCPLYSDFAESGSYSTSLRLPEHISSGSYWLVSEQNGYKHVQLLNVVK